MGCKARDGLQSNVERVLANCMQSTHAPSNMQDLRLSRPLEIETLYAVP